ncbi:unnamed protein product [Rhizophagus irregularis]|nr:unnamed protein product [Rhizophagus irregularis]
MVCMPNDNLFFFTTFFRRIFSLCSFNFDSTLLVLFTFGFGTNCASLNIKLGFIRVLAWSPGDFSTLGIPWTLFFCRLVFSNGLQVLTLDDMIGIIFRIIIFRSDLCVSLDIAN